MRLTTLPVELLLETALLLSPADLASLLLTSSYLTHTLLAASHRLHTPALLHHCSIHPRTLSLLHTLLTHRHRPTLPSPHPLHTAAAAGNTPALRLLLQHYPPHPTDRKHRTPLEVAAHNNNVASVQLLSTFSPTAATLASALILTTSTAITQNLLTLSKLDPSTPIAAHMGSPLQLAAKNGDAEKVRALMCAVRRRGGVDERDFCGWTALHWAVFGGWAEVVRVLVEGGADWEVRTDEGVGCGELRGEVEEACATLVGVAA